MVDYRKGRGKDELEPFFPNEILRHTLLTFFLISAVLVAVITFPESFQKATGEFSTFQTRPPWYLLPFYQLSFLVKSRGCYSTVLAVFALFFLAIPFLDRNPKRRLWKKPVFLSLVILSLSLVIILGLMRYLK
ncbi:MAG: hypothetical protein D8M57_10750 [Candidatus Scalindua sp. AMX11]|nr:MAG: hypothetical protein DWQ00_03255 [Candidatus Scalindua sp.]NOG83116.1 hypothetical protein [Planctomycetota bacterium]RZV75867.1 MAG: hypothetical protein EX341_12525 [Candidatus Scalindua sp. SCAELEC01]TDE64926.1 MAG: hypothetical protein D8M57_10750 [Candidatus Scalindua sp. AMX11]GJQ60227.1 MAG: hypothetical protein SCALA701_30280 [Candidatus Scalindua sp.]